MMAVYVVAGLACALMAAVVMAFRNGVRFDNPVLLVLFTVACCGIMVAAIGLEILTQQQRTLAEVRRSFTALADFLNEERGERLDQRLPDKPRRKPEPSTARVIRSTASRNTDSAAGR